jgi:N-terminal domain of anti-restriction factor ArdC
MTKTTTTKKANADKGGKADIDWTATFVEALNAPGALGNTYCRFYNYSFLNQIRLMMQGCMEPVATYRRWAELGYQVQKGMKAKVVLAPLIITKRDSTGKPVLKNGKTQQVLVGFRESRTVFGFSDTDGDELPEIELPAWDSKLALKTLGIKRDRFKKADGNVQGYSFEDETGKHVAINPAAKYKSKTLLHEMAHIVLGHTSKEQIDEYQTHRGIKEFEAESVAYLVAKELELTDWAPAESRAYINHWLENDGHDPEGSNGSAFDEKNISRIFAAANKILTAGQQVKEQAA